MRRAAMFFSVVSIACLLTGCGSGGPETVRVTGNVNYDGAAVTEGDIVFVSTDPAAPSTAARISGGAYAMDAMPGEKKVEIRATRVVPGKVNMDNPGSNEPALEMYIPTKYNVESTLKQSVPAEGGQIDFDLPK